MKTALCTNESCCCCCCPRRLYCFILISSMAICCVLASSRHTVICGTVRENVRHRERRADGNLDPRANWKLKKWKSPGNELRERLGARSELPAPLISPLFLRHFFCLFCAAPQLSVRLEVGRCLHYACGLWRGVQFSRSIPLQTFVIVVRRAHMRNLTFRILISCYKITVWHEIFPGFIFANRRLFTFCGNKFLRL